MLNRWIGILAAATMLLGNGAVILRDLAPYWLPNDPPRSDAQILQPDETRLTQVGLYGVGMRPLGRSWTRSTRSALGDIVTVHTTTVLAGLEVGGATTPRVRIETQLEYRAGERTVDEVEFKMHGLGFPIVLTGAAMPTGEFACQWQVGLEKGTRLLDATTPAIFGDVIRPFDRLPGLYVGQTWRIKLLDPLSQMLPNLQQTSGFELDALVIRVTRTEMLEHNGKQVETFVVEGGGAQAWVNTEGQVLRQVVTLPLIGQILLLDEPYDARARERAVKSVRNEGF